MHKTEYFPSEIVPSKTLLLFYVVTLSCTRRKLISSHASAPAKISIKLEDGIEILDLTHSSPSTESVDADHGAGADNSAAGTQLPDSMDTLDPTSSPSPSNPASCVEDVTLLSEEDYDADNNDSIIRFPDDLPCDCSLPTLAMLYVTLEKWRRLPLEKPRIQWLSQYEDELKHARETSDKVFNDFYRDTFAHVGEGGDILQAVQDVITMPCPRCREGLKYDIPLLYDILTVLLAELEFYKFLLITFPFCE